MIELTYIKDHEELGGVIEGAPTIKHFKTWKSVDKFVKEEKIDKYKVEGQSAGGNLLQYTSILWEDFMANHGWVRNR
jgi:hypothetical protein